MVTLLSLNWIPKVVVILKTTLGKLGQILKLGWPILLWVLIIFQILKYGDFKCYCCISA